MSFVCYGILAARFLIVPGKERATVRRLLTARQDQILREERDLLQRLQVLLARMGAPDADIARLQQALRQLEETFLLVVVGEFNAGKSAVINALLGDRYLEEGVIPTTNRLQLIRYGEPTGSTVENGLLVVQVPVDWLQEVHLVDTPGTNAVIREHERITEEFIPRSDLVLFVTSADRPFSESERAFLEKVRRWGKKVVLVVNKMDLLQSEAERAQVLEFVAQNARQLLGMDPPLFPVSARLALQAKQAARQNGRPLMALDEWMRSGFQALEEFIQARLNQEERLRLKLENPLGIAAVLVDTYKAVLAERRALLQEDFETLDAIERQLEAYQEDMRRDFQYQRSRVDTVLYEMAERGDRFFDETLRITRVLELVNGERLRGEFERRVVGDTSRQIEAYVHELIDWLVERDYRQWQSVMEYLNRRATHHADRLVGQVKTEFELNRQSLLQSIGRSAREVVESYDREQEALKLAQEVQRAIVQTAAVEVGALGLGALLVAILHTTLLDITGVLGASAIAALGLYVLPYRRQKIKAELRRRIQDLRERLDEALTRQFEAELTQSVHRIREAIAPYTRFVRTEREKLAQLQEELAQIERDLARLRHELEALNP